MQLEGKTFTVNWAQIYVDSVTTENILIGRVWANETEDQVQQSLRKTLQDSQTTYCFINHYLLPST